MQKHIISLLGAACFAFITVPAMAETMTDAGKAPDHMANQVITQGDLTLSGGFTRATLPNAPVAGGFVTITNAGTDDDRLVSASADGVAGRVEIHEMAMQGDVMKMRQLPDGLEIPAGETVELKPGSYHLMLMELAKPLVEGDSIVVRLVFEKAGDITVTLPVMARAARMAPQGGHNMDMDKDKGEHAGH